MDADRNPGCERSVKPACRGDEDDELRNMFEGL
jgi:hypothetical protein